MLSASQTASIGPSTVAPAAASVNLKRRNAPPSTLEELLDSFDETIKNLRWLADLRSPTVSKTFMEDARTHELFDRIGWMESRMGSIKLTLQKTAELLDEKNAGTPLEVVGEDGEIVRTRSMTPNEILEHMAVTNAMLQDMAVNIPKHLPKVVHAPPPSAVAAGSGAGLAQQQNSSTNSQPVAAATSDAAEYTQSQQETQRVSSSSTKKLPTISEVAPLTVDEYESIPKYILNRMSRDKVNDMIMELNKVYAEKSATLKLPHSQMTKVQRGRYWEHKKLVTAETKGRVFVTEKDINENHTKSGFKLDRTGRAIIAILRHLGRVKEVRGGNNTRIVLV